MDSAALSIIDHRFALEEVIGEGGMGKVWRARDCTTGERVAVKRVVRENDGARRRFAREASLLARLQHPGIVRYIAHGSDTGVPYLAMEWLDGISLHQYLQRASGPDRQCRALPLDASVALALRIAEAVAEMYRLGAVHRDINPANLFLVDGSLAQVKLIDLGLSRELQSETLLTKPGTIMGTPFYMAPEQVHASAAITPATDIWGIGCVLYQCITGRRPFESPDIVSTLARILMDEPVHPTSLCPNIPDALSDLLLSTLAKDPAQRPRDCAELAALLAPFRAEVTAVCGSTNGAVQSASDRLTHAECRVQCVLLVDTSHARVHTDDASVTRTITSVARRYGVSAQPLIDRTVILTGSASGVPTDQATRLAHTALALRRVRPDLVMHMHTLARERTSATASFSTTATHPAAIASGAIAVAPDLAPLVDPRFHLVRHADYIGLERERTQELQRAPAVAPGPYEGRRRELAMLTATFDECIDERVARATLITGDAGMGKSRLWRELVQAVRLRDEAVTVLVSHGDVTRTRSPFVMLTQMLMCAADIDSGTPFERRFNWVHARLQAIESADQRRDTAAVLARLCDATDTGEPLPGHDPTFARKRTRDAWVRWLDAECANGPVLVVLDDLQWGDQLSIDCMDTVLENLAHRPLMVLALARPEIHDAFPSLWNKRQVDVQTLKPLSRAACARLVRSALGDNADDQFIAQLVARSDGNAFCLEELIRAVGEGNVDALPATVLGMIQARLDTLANESRRVLRAASVFGKVFWESGVEALLGDDGLFQVRDWLAHLVEQGLVVSRPHTRLPGQLEYAFQHALVRDAAYATLTQPDRQLGHLLAARWLIQAGENDPMGLAEHYLDAGEDELACDHLRRAARNSLDAGDFATAAHRAARAVAAGAQGDSLGQLHAIQSLACYWVNDYAGALSHGDVALALLPQGTAAWFQTLGSAMVASFRLGREYDAYARFEWARRAQCKPGAEGDQLTVWCRGALQAIVRGRRREMIPVIGQIKDRITNTPNLPLRMLANAADALALDAMCAGDFLESIRQSTVAAELYKEARDTANAWVSRCAIAWGWLELGDYAAAARICDRIRAECEPGNRVASTLADTILGAAAVHLADRGVEQSRQLLWSSIDRYREAENRMMEGVAWCHLASVEYAVECYNAVARAAAAGAELLRDNVCESWALALQSLGLLGLERGAEAHALAEQAIVAFERTGGVPHGFTAVYLALALGRSVAGDRSAARSAFAEAVKVVRRIDARLGHTEQRAQFAAIPFNRHIIVRAAELA